MWPTDGPGLPVEAFPLSLRLPAYPDDNTTLLSVFLPDRANPISDSSSNARSASLKRLST